MENLLNTYYPWQARQQNIKEIKNKLKKIPLNTPTTKPEITPEETNHIQGNIIDRTITKYQTTKKNLETHWKKTKDKNILHALIYIQTLQPLNEEINKSQVEDIKTPTLLEYLTAFTDEIQKLLTTYTEYHTPTKPKDDIEQIYGDIQNL